MLDSLNSLFLTFECISQLQKPFNTRVTHQASQKALSKEKLRLLRTNSSRISVEENMSNFKTHLQNRGYPAARMIENHLSEIKFSDRELLLAQKNKTAHKKILPLVTQYHLALPNLMDTLIENQTQLRNIFKEPPVISYCKGKSLKGNLVKAKLWRLYELSCRSRVGLSTLLPLLI